VTESKQFRIRSDVQGRQTEDAPSVSALHVEKLLASEIREWLAAPRTLLQLTCGDTRFTVTAAEQPHQATPSRTEAADDTANDLVTEQSEESFPASDPPSSTGTATGPGRR
jgi:hypothetical protein